MFREGRLSPAPIVVSKRIYALFADFRVDSSCWTGFLLDQDTNNIQGDANYRLDYGGYGVAL